MSPLYVLHVRFARDTVTDTAQKTEDNQYVTISAVLPVGASPTAQASAIEGQRDTTISIV